MATTEELLTQLNAVKQDIKTAIVNKGVAMDNVPFTDYAGKINEIETGGGGGGEPTTGAYYVKVIDYDGTVLLESRGNNGDTVTLPTPPTHDRLVFQGWSCSQDIVDNAVTFDNNNIMVGAVYETASGKTEFDITLTKVTGLTVTLQNLTGVTEIDWGDGTVNNTLSHTYATYGDYMISVSGVTSLGQNIFSQSTSNRNYYCTNARLSSTVTSISISPFYMCYSLTSIVIPQGVTSIGSNTFYMCNSLTSIVIPQGVTSIGSGTFNVCRSLTSIVIPQGVTEIGLSAFSSCYSLPSIVIPQGVTSIDISAFSSCYHLTSIVIPQGVTEIGLSAFNSCYSLTSIVIPQGVTNIDSSAFGNCLSLIDYDFTQATQVPTLSNSNVFTNINGIAKIYVPDALYDEWIVATNWATYVDYIYKASERS